jgi:hypothetical protein
MKTKLMNFRVEELVHTRIKRAAQAAHESVTDFLLGAAALRMKAMAGEPCPVDPLDQAFAELFRSGRVAPLNAAERAQLQSFARRKAGGKLKTLGSDEVLADIDAETGRKRSHFRKRA